VLISGKGTGIKPEMTSEVIQHRFDRGGRSAGQDRARRPWTA
jgi:hypothetical protein